MTVAWAGQCARGRDGGVGDVFVCPGADQPEIVEIGVSGRILAAEDDGLIGGRVVHAGVGEAGLGTVLGPGLGWQKA